MHRLLRSVLPAAAALAILALPAPARALTADEVVEKVHLSRALRKHQLNGYLEKNDRKVPFNVSMESDVIRFRFSSPTQIITLNINEKGAKLYESSGGQQKAVPASRYSEGIRGTDLTYEDISFRYLYWPQRVLWPKTETVKTRRCHVVDLYNPDTSGSYAIVRIFVDQESGALMQMEGYDRSNARIKVCKVTSGMKVDGATVLKSMDVIRYGPDGKKVLGETEFELRRP